MTEKQEFIEKFDRNADLIKNFIYDYGLFIEKNNCGEKQAFIDSNMTNNQYFTVLKQISKKRIFG